MTYVETYIQLVGGLIWLVMGGDLLVRGAVGLARRAHLSQMVVALTVVAFGTSLPELVVSLLAALRGFPGIAIGNVVGSNIANAFLVIGAPAVIYPLVCEEPSLKRDSTFMFVVSILFVLLCLVGDLTRFSGLVLLAGLAAVTGFTARETARTQRKTKSAPLEWVLGLPTSSGMIAFFIVVGAIGLPVGARMMVEAAVEVAGQLGVAETVVGLTIIAVGTSLPELVTTLIAATRRQTEVALGTAIGSNVFNILAIMGVTALVSPVPIPVPPGFLSLDLPVMLFSAMALTYLAWRRPAIGRSEGVLLLLGYAVYVAALFGGV